MLHAVIVVVDDNTDFLTFIETVLAMAGYTVLSCWHSATALNLIRERMPNIITLDLRMQQSGFDILAAIRSDNTTAHIPVLLCSADVEALRHYTATHHDSSTAVLAKPFEINELLAALHHLQHSRPHHHE